MQAAVLTSQVPLIHNRDPRRENLLFDTQIDLVVPRSTVPAPRPSCSPVTLKSVVVASQGFSGIQSHPAVFRPHFPLMHTMVPVALYPASHSASVKFRLGVPPVPPTPPPNPTLKFFTLRSVVVFVHPFSRTHTAVWLCMVPRTHLTLPDAVQPASHLAGVVVPEPVKGEDPSPT